MRIKTRKAITPIIATVLIIAVTLIAGVAIAAFVFGILGSGASTAQVAATSVTLHAGATAGSIVLLNTGTANTQVAASTSITLSYGGTTCTYALANAAATTITAGGAPVPLVVPATASTSVGVYCTGATAAPGEAFVGSIPVTNGEQVQFAGSFAA